MTRRSRSVCPRHGDTKVIVADGHDVGASHGCLSNAEHGRTGRRFTHWLTPSGGLIEEGRRYRVRWVERFRGARYDGTVDLLRYRGAWEVDSEALDGTVGAEGQSTPRGQA